jgi:hypothetical protein
VLVIEVAVNSKTYLVPKTVKCLIVIYDVLWPQTESGPSETTSKLLQTQGRGLDNGAQGSGYGF